MAPLLVEPCLTASVAPSKARIEADRAAGDPSSGAHDISLGAQLTKSEPGAASTLLDEGRMLHRLENRLHRVGDRQHETGRKHLELSSGVHQCGRIGEILQAPHHLVELLLGGAEFRFPCAVIPVGLGQIASHPPEHLVRLLDDTTIPVLGLIATLQHRLRVVSKLG